jgi:uncharacterized LabA/DUF88 family protein
MSVDTKAASFYVDGRNLASYGQRFATDREIRVDPGAIVKEISASTRGLEMDSVAYFTGLPAADTPAFRAREVYKLNKLADRGVRTSANDLEYINGRAQEVGVDLRMGAEMIEDFLTHGVRKFVILSNDRDFEPIVEKLLELSHKARQPIKIYNAVHGTSHALQNTIRLTISDRMIQNALVDWRPFDKDCIETYTQDPQKKALDASRHEKHSAPGHPISGPSEGVALLVDLQSLSKTAVGSDLQRPYLDVSPPDLMRTLESEKGWKVVAKTAYSCIHDRAVNLKAAIFTSDLLNRMAESKFAAKQFIYQYTKQTVSDGRGGPERVVQIPREKKIHAAMLVDAMTMARQDVVQTIVIMSDDRNLAPIVPLVKRIAKMRGEDNLRVIHLKADERTKTYDGAESIVITKEHYLAHLDPVDRMKQADATKRDVLLQDIGVIDDNIRAGTGIEPEFVLRPEQSEGRHVLKSDYWSAFRQDDGAIALYDNENLPFQPVVKQSYRITERGRALEAISERLRPMSYDGGR